MAKLNRTFKYRKLKERKQPGNPIGFPKEYISSQTNVNIITDKYNCQL